REGAILAVKGLGGYHLACDATSEAAVARLRERKHREEKPLAVMVASVDEAARVAVVGAEARRLLAGPERPIVLLDRRPESGLAAGIAPGNPQVGLVLPYSPLHHLLMADVGRPLVMTSGNVSDEPIATANADAIARLSGIADLFLVHDREIVTAADDSVARVIAGAPVLLRRSRGYVPRAIPLAEAVERPVLAVGGLLKNTCCVLTGHDAFLGPHIGDLDHLSAYQAFETSVRRMVEFLGVTPEVVAYDLHPGYHSTWFAKQWRGVTHVGVQHHHAHVAAVMAEHGVAGPVTGVAYDGTGFGVDGTAWGGEILRVDRDGMTRLATFRPLPLAGGDAAIKAPWRIALALVDDAWGGPAPIERLRLFDDIEPRDVAVVRQMVAARLHTAPAHGVGRYFDAVGALVLRATRASFEGQVATALGAAADAADHGLYPYDIQRDASPWQIDLRPAVRGIVDDLWRHVAPGVIAARFHRTIGAATAEVVEAVARPGVREPVVLGGGCFQNALLVEDVMARLQGAEILLPRQAPPGDGGLALGQAMVAHWTVSAYGVNDHEPRANSQERSAKR
ncbi:MAG: carbamoyltransferase HypF, partial [Vicinamibacteria bacterium]